MRSLLSAFRAALSFHYLEDGMGTNHVAEFLRDQRFVRAYQKGVATGSWCGCELRWRVYNACWAAKHALNLRADFVECGVNLGGISRAVMEYIDFGSVSQHFFLLDTYCGAPDVHELNRLDYRDCYEDVLKTFAPFPNCRIIRGRVPETLPKVTSNRIGYLSLDMNNPIPEVAALKFFWDKLVSGAIVVLDDYSYSEVYRSTRNAMDRAAEELGTSIWTMPTGQGIIVKM